MTRSALTLVGSVLSATLLIVSTALFSLSNTRVKSVLGTNTNLSPAEILSRVNAIRLENNLPTLKINEQLMKAAEAKAEAMQSAGYWSHDDTSGTPPWHFLEEAGYEYIFAGENLAKDFFASEHLISAWLKSPSHRANILNPVYTETGIAVLEGQYLGKENTTLIVQYFATPISALEQYAGQEPEFHTSLPLISMMNNKSFNTIIYSGLLTLSVLLFTAAYQIDKKNRRRSDPPLHLWRH